MSPLPETLVHYRTDLEEAIGREQAARLRQGRRRQRVVALAAGILVGGLLVTPAFGIGGRLLALIESAPGPREVQAPVWSPGGRQIAFLSRRGVSNFDLDVVNADGSGQRTLIHGATREPPSWSPDGLKIAFESLRDRAVRLHSERRRKRAAAACARREGSCLVARRAHDRVLQRRQDLPHERRRERAPGPDEAAGGTEGSCVVARRAEVGLPARSAAAARAVSTFML